MAERTDSLGGIVTDDPGRALQALLGKVRAMEPKFRKYALGLWGVALVSEATQDGVVPRRTGLLASQHSSKVTGDVVTITANTSYAAAVHERHPTLKRWLLNTITRYAGPLFEKIAPKAFERAANEAIAGRGDTPPAEKNGGGA